MQDSSRPKKPPIQPLMGEPAEVSEPQIVTPKTASRAISAEVNFRERVCKKGVHSTSKIMPNRVPIKDPRRDRERAVPPWLFLASGWPSKIVAAAEPVPGIPMRMEAMEPPNIAPT